MHQSYANSLKQSAIALTRSIAKAENLPPFPVSSSGKLLFQNKRLKTEQLTLKYARETYLKRKDSVESSSKLFEFETTQKDSRIREMQDVKKRDAHLLRTFLGRLRQERDFTKMYNQREKSYKIWRLRADKLVAQSNAHK